MDSWKWIILAMGVLLSTGFAHAGQPVDINRASAEEIAEALDGVGLSKAEAIVAYRKANGAYKHRDELINVKGIGMSTVERNRDYIQIGAVPARKPAARKTSGSS
ncbi:MAG: ComEA family DNA-binding protein [Pseudomonadota bacterium]